jgi:MYXO-CTERM domain-containing protein
LSSLPAAAAPWSENPDLLPNITDLPSSKVDAADLNGDGTIDLVFANGAGYNKGDPDSPQTQQALLNEGGGMMTDVSDVVFGGGKLSGRAVKLRDIDYDGDIDILLGTTWITQSRIFINDGAGNFTDETGMNFPALSASVGDLEVGDVDDDNDLDIALANWGDDADAGDDVVDSPAAGGVTLLWSQLGDDLEPGQAGTGMFEDVTGAKMPNLELRWSWDLEFVDIDNDYQLDLVISCFACDDRSLYVFHNDGGGNFSDVNVDNAQGLAALDVEAINIDGDEFLDLVTLQDGQGGRNRALRNNGNGGFVIDQMIWPQTENPSSRDFMGAFYDYDSDGDPDLVLGALKTTKVFPDRLMQNQAGIFKQWSDGMGVYQALQEVTVSGGTYAIVLADFNGDFKLDVAMSQNENALEKKLYLAGDETAVDTQGPVFVNYQKLPPLQFPDTVGIRVRCHDNKSPLMLHDFTQTDGFPYIESWIEDPGDPEINPGDKSAPAWWYGEYLWKLTFQVPDADALWYRICAIDAAGNKRCTPIEMTTIEGGTETTAAETSTTTDPTTSTGDDATITDPTTLPNTDSETDTLPEPTETFTASGGQTMGTISESESTSDSATDTIADSASELDDDGCGCDAGESPARGALASLALLGLLGLRRRRR